MNDTPETDAVAVIEGNWDTKALRMGDFARNLERECNDLRAIFPRILEALDSGACASNCSVDFLREIPREVGLVRQRLERERDSYEEALRRIYAVAIDGDEIWSDIAQISAISHNALNKH